MKEREERVEASEREGFDETHIVRFEQDMVEFLHEALVKEEGVGNGGRRRRRKEKRRGRGCVLSGIF